MYPRLIQRYGKEYAKKVLINPGHNINERHHPILGECNSASRDNYLTGWRRSLKQRVKPLRDEGLPLPTLSSSTAFTDGLTSVSGPSRYEAQPGSSCMDPKYNMLRQKVAETLSQIRLPQLNEYYRVGEVVGAGREGTVRTGFPLKDSCDSLRNLIPNNINCQTTIAAIKSVDKLPGGASSMYNAKTAAQMSKEMAETYREVQVLEKLNEHHHPNISPYMCTFESPIRLHILTEFCGGGDLFSYLQDHDFEKLDEHTAARVILKLFSAVMHSHESGYVHLDIKLENIMRKENGPEIDSGDVVLIDFGHAAKMPKNKKDDKSQAKDMVANPIGRLLRPVGSPSYAAPEVVLDKLYSAKSDVWSLGVVMYIFLQGYLPFPHLQKKKWREFTIDDYGNFDGQHPDNDPFGFDGDWEGTSSSALDLCKKLLQVDVTKRLSVVEAVNHPWFKQNRVFIQRNEENVPIVKIMQENEDDSHESGALKRLFSYL